MYIKCALNKEGKKYYSLGYLAYGNFVALTFDTNAIMLYCAYNGATMPEEVGLYQI